MTKIKYLRAAYEVGYRVHVDGSVTNKRGDPVRLLEKTQSKSMRKRSPNGSRYLYFSLRVPVSISKRRQSKQIFVHRFQAWQKWGDKIDGKHVRHLDGDAYNNSIENLAIGTASENSMDRPVEERIRSASNASPRKHHKIAATVRADRDSGMTYPQLVKKYDLAKSTLHFILNNAQY